MKLFDILKQFKSIAPDAQFSERTKRDVLAAPQREPLAVRGILSVFHMVETGVAVALAGLFILILTGGLGGGNSISPVQYSVIDPTGLRAEAQAIDIQIKLADVSYPQVTSTAGVASSAEASALTQALSKVLAPKSATSTAASATSSASGATSTSTASTTTLSVDQALQQLSH